MIVEFKEFWISSLSLGLEVSVPKHRCLSVCLNKHLICTITPLPCAGLKIFLSYCHRVVFAQSKIWYWHSFFFMRKMVDLFERLWYIQIPGTLCFIYDPRHSLPTTEEHLKSFDHLTPFISLKIDNYLVFNNFGYNEGCEIQVALLLSFSNHCWWRWGGLPLLKLVQSCTT